MENEIDYDELNDALAVALNNAEYECICHDDDVARHGGCINVEFIWTALIEASNDFRQNTIDNFRADAINWLKNIEKCSDISL